MEPVEPGLAVVGHDRHPVHVEGRVVGLTAPDLEAPVWHRPRLQAYELIYFPHDRKLLDLLGAHYVLTRRLVPLHQRSFRHHHDLPSLDRLLLEDEIHRHRIIDLHVHVRLRHRPVSDHRRSQPVLPRRHRQDQVAPVHVRTRAQSHSGHNYVRPRQGVALPVGYLPRDFTGRRSFRMPGVAPQQAQRQHADHKQFQISHIPVSPFLLARSGQPGADLRRALKDTF